jgi:hypothetical protein
MGGWDLVDYSEAEDPISEHLFGRLKTWQGPDHDHIWVDYLASGTECGSFSIRGVREYNLLDFDLKKQVACGVRPEDATLKITGINPTLSRIVNLFLEAERDSGLLCFNDVDFLQFVMSLEEKWRGRVTKPN